ncbi:MAG: methyltransferase domain-containing protein [Deltaproteobacteria bacterium]|nr:methyltransferase domain-containing protein [Deltaproteobacteria bacterium]
MATHNKKTRNAGASSGSLEHEVLPHQVQDLLLAPLRFWAVGAIFELGIFSALRSGPLSRAAVAEHCHCSGEHLEHLLNVGVHLNLLEKNGTIFGLSPQGRASFGLKEEISAGHLFRHFALYFEPLWRYLPDALRTSFPQWQREFPVPPVGNAEHSESSLEMYQLAFHCLALAEGATLADAFDWSQFGTVLDVGGGTGALCLALLHRYPLIEAVCIDTPPVCRLGERLLSREACSGRLRFMGGDMFSLQLPRADAVILSFVCTASEKTSDLLGKCCRSLPRGGWLVVADKIDGGEPGDLFALIKLNALLWEDGGIDVGSAEFAEQLSARGMRRERVVQTRGFRDYVLFVRE